MNAAQEATQHLMSIFKLLLDCKLDEIHGGRLQRRAVLAGGDPGCSVCTEGFSSSAMGVGGEEGAWQAS